MSKQILVIIIAALAVVILILGLNAVKGKQEEESSAEESVAAVTDIIIIPAEMPARITFDVPPGFNEAHSEAYDKFYTREDASVIISGEEQVIRGIQLEEYTDQVKEQYQNTADEYLLIGDEETTLSGGLKCRVLEFTYAIIGEDVHQQMQCITAVIMKDNYAYIVTCKSKKENFGIYRAAFLKMIESINIADDPDNIFTQPQQSDQTVPAMQIVS